jgi:hypothetical protein
MKNVLDRLIMVDLRAFSWEKNIEIYQISIRIMWCISGIHWSFRYSTLSPIYRTIIQSKNLAKFHHIERDKREFVQAKSREYSYASVYLLELSHQFGRIWKRSKMNTFVRTRRMGLSRYSSIRLLIEFKLFQDRLWWFRFLIRWGMTKCYCQTIYAFKKILYLLMQKPMNLRYRFVVIDVSKCLKERLILEWSSTKSSFHSNATDDWWWWRLRVEETSSIGGQK